jgi:hypothetical protein
LLLAADVLDLGECVLFLKVLAPSHNPLHNRL